MIRKHPPYTIVQQREIGIGRLWSWSGHCCEREASNYLSGCVMERWYFHIIRLYKQQCFFFHWLLGMDLISRCALRDLFQQ